MTTKNQNRKNIIFYIRRYNPEVDSKPYWQEFSVDVEPGMTVLDGLHQIQETQDATLSLRYSCRMGVCGSCGMLLNGRPSLACNTQILDIAAKKLTVASLPNFNIIKDLVPDLTPLFEKHTAIHPYIIQDDTDEMLNPSGELYQNPNELTEYLQFTYCIKCGLCMSACPTMATDPDYLGPQSLAQSYRYNKDTRDNGFNLRKEIVSGVNGAFRCHYAGECSNVCPKGVDPARAIQHMKRELVWDYLKLKKHQPKAHVLDKPKEAAREIEVPKPPPFTIKQ
ncbi:MAG: succinate dehydrogenase iron-sulfur subunit [candidate division Zixibacteria bacterium]|nr:succinate dehydrogenase iron-sulfur subunit [candidate division Zixibacteria bacterium]